MKAFVKKVSIAKVSNKSFNYALNFDFSFNFSFDITASSFIRNASYKSHTTDCDPPTVIKVLISIFQGQAKEVAALVLQTAGTFCFAKAKIQTFLRLASDMSQYDLHLFF